jgi:hypothetical protein
MFRIVLLNLGFLASLAIPLLLPGVILKNLPVLAIIVFVVGVSWCSVYLAASALSVKAVSDYGSFGFHDFFRNLKAAWPAGLILSGIIIALCTVAWIIIPFYLEMASVFGLLLAAVIFWTLALTVLSFQWFFSIRARLDTKPKKIIKKCFIIFFDNAGFSLFCLLYNIVGLVFSVILAFLMPGPAGILLYLDEGLRLRLLKYDWLEANPEATPSRKRRKIPWDAILIEEREKTGTRTLKNFIFPWKD